MGRPKKIKASVEMIEVEKVEDRSAYNCPECKGDGLVAEQRCGKCAGTGKV